MWTLFSISLGNNKPEFAVLGMVDAGHGVVQFQGTCNGGVFVASDSYELVRQEVMAAVELNQANADGLQ
jgi:hypothetical protein